MTKKKDIVTSGMRKRAVARAVLTPGKGMVRINGVALDSFEPKLARLKLQEPLFLVDDIAKTVHIDITVSGGGFLSQVEAARVAMCRALSQQGGVKVRKSLVDYDRSFLVPDTRRKETRKPNDSKARAKRQKSYR